MYVKDQFLRTSSLSQLFNMTVMKLILSNHVHLASNKYNIMSMSRLSDFVHNFLECGLIFATKVYFSPKKFFCI